MKKIALILSIFIWVVSVNAQTINDPARYAGSSVLSSGRWIKIAVAKNGIYKLTYEDLNSMGINPAQVRVYGYGGALLPERFTEPYIDDLPEVAIYMNKGSDNVFNAGDYILFYAQGTESWKYGSTTDSKTMFYHSKNHYSDLGYYFITSKFGEGKRISLQQAESQQNPENITSFTDYDLHEEDLVNLANGGREFYGEEFNSQHPYYFFSFDKKNILFQQAKFRIDVASKATANTNLSVNVNGSVVNTVPIPARNSGNQYEKASTKDAAFDFTPQSANQLTVQLNYSLPSTAAYLNFFEFNITRALTIDNNEFYFRNVDNLGQNKTNKFCLTTNTPNAYQIWELTEADNIGIVPSTQSSNELNFIANTNSVRQFLAINPSGNFPKPIVIGVIPNQNLHALPQADMIIISHSSFLQQAERLAAIHSAEDGIRTHIVDVQHVYNEFSSGTPDATAYRRFMKMFYDRGLASGNVPKYLLLFGDGTYDNRNILKNGDKLNKLLTYQAVNSTNVISAYVSDDYFGYLDDNDVAMLANASNKIKIGIGRFPVSTAEQAKAAVDKTISYMNNAVRGDWKNTLLFIGDDGDGNSHMNSANEVAGVAQQANNDVLIKKLFLDAFKQETSAAGESYPLANDMLDNCIKQGVLMINYMGHGSYNGWTNEKLLTTSKIVNMSNDKYPLFVTATCDFSGFDQFIESGGEQLLWNKKGGTMALFTTTRTVFSNGNTTLNRYFSENIFRKDSITDEPLTLGEILKRAKNLQINDANKFSFMLIGDPALKLVYPYQVNVITDSINYQPVNSLMYDTISALSVVNIAGHIETRYGDEILNYNGYITVNVFDKVDTITTLANDVGSTPFKYQDRPNLIFRGSALVADGKFNITFMIPKDIKYNFGTGRIVYYTTEDGQGLEGNGSFENFVVGGENPNPTPDNRGPDIELFMNTYTFKEGQTINTSPLFIAEVADESGINTVGSGIGHDIILRMDKNDSKEIVLNNYYISKMGSYKEGKIEYQLSDLAEGKYNLFFRVWDLQNNSSSKVMSFVVSKSTKIDVSIAAYPNPAVDFVNFIITHDRPYKPLDITVKVYDVAGRQLWHSAAVTATTGTQTAIRWDFAAEGMSVRAGIYLVRLEISTQGEKSEFKTVKLIIK
ncbi:MAG: type IX secretion system sortase PorU [Prevotellaceae bacterium]|jgi:hypothetical protein|nr:type IX secretion system sortase PorU [Prevotellaceae bacterium]